MIVEPVLSRVPDFSALIAQDGDDSGFAALRAAETTGRPVGAAEFVADLERRLGRPIARRAPGRKPQDKAKDQLGLL